jgi:pimeloyl-ACP methyl ester carboxylesterase
MAAAMSPLAVGQDLQDKFFDSKGVRIRYVEQGTGEPVVLVHGFGGRANAVADRVFQRLAKNYRVIAFDCRGHGKSDKPHDAKQYGQEMALDVVRLLDHLKIKQAHIVGYSMGGLIVAKLLTMKPQRFLTATLGGSGGVLDPTESEVKLYQQLVTDIEHGSLRTLLLALAPRDQPPTEEQMKQIEASFFGRNDSAALAAVTRSWRDLAITEAQVARIKVPTIAIIGSSDPSIERVKKLKSAMPKLKVVSIEKATHETARERPEFIAALEEFLKENPIKK